MESLTGTIERIVYHNDETQWTVARLRAAEGLSRYRARDDAHLTTIVGSMPGVNVGESLEMQGEWQLHPQHGRNFRVHTFEPKLPSTVDGIRRYLGSGLIKGIGPKTAERIVAHFSERTLEMIEQDPERLREVNGISARKVSDIATAWLQQKDIKNLMLFLQSHEVAAGLAARIYKAYGANAVNVIREDPYRLARDVHGIGFITADTLAQKLGLPEQSPQRHMAGLKHMLTEAVGEGHVFLPRDELLARAAAALHAEPTALSEALDTMAPGREIVVDQVRPEKGSNAGTAIRGGSLNETPASASSTQARAAETGAVEEGDPDEELAAQERVYLAPFFHSERGSARRLKLLAETPSTLLFARNIDWERAFAGLQGAERIELAPGQRAAVQSALANKISVLTGGPGVGKTTTLRAALHLLEHYGIRYCLTAPTGRAAKRMSEATGRAASTMHRLLQFSPGQNEFGYNEENPLPYSFVVVDESSMIDIILFYALLRAVAPTAHLLLVGDADQLPSVGAGNVLRDLISSQVLPVTRLTTLFRQAEGSRIITTAHAINHGTVPSIEATSGSDFFFIQEENPSRIMELVKTVVAERAPRAFGLDPVSDVQVISPVHRGPLGVGALNEALQELLNPPRVDDVTIGNRVFRPGDKVMQIHNNYTKNVFNGDMGRVARIDRDDRVLYVHYPAEGLPITRLDDLAATPSQGRNRPASPIVPTEKGGYTEVAYEYHETDELVHAYAVSVHKSQGSEFPAVVMPLTPAHHMMLQRNLVYTAITRARRLCVLIGSPRALAIAVNNSRVDRRYTGLAERLRAAPPRRIA